jgi:hypothetical protein
LESQNGLIGVHPTQKYLHSLNEFNYEGSFHLGTNPNNMNRDKLHEFNCDDIFFVGLHTTFAITRMLERVFWMVAWLRQT